jgi:uncharacterized membrane protein
MDNSVEYSNGAVKQPDILRAIIVGIGLLFFNLIFIVGPFFGLAGALIGFISAGIGIFIAGIAMALGGLLGQVIPSLFPFTGYQLTVTMFSGIGLGSLGALFIIGMYYVSKYFVKFTGTYVKGNIRLIRGS